MSDATGFLDALIEAPVGVALLAGLESRASRRDGYPPVVVPSSDGISAAVDLVGAMSFGELVELATFVAVIDVGPWIPDAARTAAAAYRHAETRAPIAQAIVDRFGDELHRPIDRDAQQWWTSENFPVDRLAPLFQDFDHVYGAGQFTWAGLWTVTDPPEVAHAQMIDAWEMYGGPISRWRLPVEPGGRVVEIHRPDDWVRLVTEHPAHAASHLECWELPGVNQSPHSVVPLMFLPRQRAARRSIRRHVVPDWRSVAELSDGVRLSWAGFITSEGCITDLGDGDVAMLRYWGSERTLWLADVFGAPEPGPPPSYPNAMLLPDSSPAVVDVRATAARRDRDRVALDRLLGRTRTTM